MSNWRHGLFDLFAFIPLFASVDIRTTDFTSQLIEELENLKSDIERARESVKKELDLTFCTRVLRRIPDA